MPDPKPPKDQRIPIMMSEQEVKAIDDWSFEHRIRSRSEAVRRLLQMALLLDQDFEQLFLATNVMHESVIAVADAAVDLRDQPGFEAPAEFQGLLEKISEALNDVYQTTLIANSIIEAAQPFRIEQDMRAALETAARAKALSSSLRADFAAIVDPPDDPKKADRAALQRAVDARNKSDE